MKIGVDLDDVLFDFIGGFVNWCDMSITVNDITSWDISKILGINKQDTYNKILDFYKTEDFATIKPIEYAQEVIEKIYNENIEIIAITARPSQETLDTTIEMVNKHYPQISTIIHYNDKQKIINNMKLCYMVDDGIHNLKGLSIYTTPLLYSKPWNSSDKFLPRVNNWYDIEKIIL